MTIPGDFLPRDRLGRRSGRTALVLLAGLVLGLALALALAAWVGWERQGVAPPRVDGPGLAALPPAVQRGLTPPGQSARNGGAVAPHGATKPAPDPQASAASREPRRADFKDEQPPAPVREVADWAVDSGDHGARAFAIVDKQGARVWLFDTQGALVQQAPALLGAAVGDDPAPGIGDKPLSQVRPEEKTTPAGRFVAEPGVNSHGEDIVWVSYDLAVSMHRVRPLVKAERRLQRLASATPADNRISFGCINLPVAFYEQVFAPMVHRAGAVIYVLPETRSAREQFGSYAVPPRPLEASGSHRRAGAPAA